MTQLLNVDIRTVLLLLSLGNLSAAALILVYGGRLRDAPDTMFALAKLLQGLAWPLLALRGEIPDALSAGLGNALLMAGFWLEPCCIRALDLAARAWSATWKTLLAATAASLAISLAIQQPNVRMAVASVLAGFSFALSGLQLLRGAPRPTLLRKTLGGTYLLLCGAVLLRGVMAFRDSGATLFTSGLGLTFSYLPLYLLMIAGSFGLLLLFKERSDLALAQLARRDFLTGAPNRRALLDMAGRLAAKAHREGSPLAVLMLDLDHFKLVNDTHGHLAGDAVLRNLTRVIAENLRVYDAYGRYGGEEFVAVLPGASRDDARQVAERIRTAAESRRPAGFEAVHYTVSIGIAWGIPGENGLFTLLHQADMAMYKAKRLGRNRVEALTADEEACARTGGPADRPA